MGFFSGIRRRIKKLIPKEVAPAVPFVAAYFGGPALAAKYSSLSPAMAKAIIAGGTRFAADDEADIKDVARAGILAAAPDYVGGKLGEFGGPTGPDPKTVMGALRSGARSVAEGIEGASALQTVGAQTATDFGIKQAELNQKAIEEYERDLLAKGIRDKASRRNAIFSIFVNAGYDDDEVNVMLDRYGYKRGGRAGRMMRGTPEMTEAMKGFFRRMDDNVMVPPKKPDSDDDEIEITDDEQLEIIETVDKDGKKRKKTKITRKDDLMDNLSTAMSGIETAYGRPFGNMEPVPMLRFAEGGDVDDDVLETEEEIITPEYLMKEEGVAIGPQVSAPDKMDSLNQLSLMLFNKPIFELTEEQFEMLKEFASDRAAMQVGYEPGKYSDDEIEMYENYKYNMNEQRPGMPIIDIDEFLRMEYGAARLGVAKGGSIKKKRVMSIATGKLKDYPGIKKILEMNKKGKKRFSKAEGGLMNLGGNEMDLRGGGFVPMGKKEKADDVPARLSKNEFVFTADAVRAAGGGSVQKGADLMYDTMKKLEAQS